MGEQEPPLVQVPVQFACVVTEQVPSTAQQEPVGCGHGLGVHVPPLVQVPVQSACVVTEQVPSAAQQEPLELSDFSPRLWNPPAAKPTKSLLGAGTLHWP